MMRLVRDEELMDVDQLEQTPTVRRARGKKIKPVMVELPDGEVGARDEAAEVRAAADGTSVNDIEIGDAPSPVGEPVLGAESHDTAVAIGALEAMLFATHHPLTAGRLAELLGLDSTKPIRGAIRSLNETYASSSRAFRIEQVAGGYQMLTLPEHGELLKQMHQKEIDAKLGKAAMETLAIIAYKQPILRAEIEAIRGVACGETIRNLMEKHVVKIAGRAEEPGRPILYGTTRRFLEVSGLNSIKDLPQPEAGAGVADASRNLQSRIEPVTDEPSPAARPADAPSQLAEAENQAAEFQAAESQVPPADANDHAL